MPSEHDRDDRPRDYLLFLLEHEYACWTENCPLCERAQELYDVIQSRFLGSKRPMEYAKKLPMSVQ